MSWVSKGWKKLKKNLGGVFGTLLMPGIGTAFGSMMDEQKKAMEQQARIAETQAAQQAAYYQQQQEKAEAEETEAKTAASATTTNMKRGLSSFLFNNNLLGVPGGKTKLN